MSAIYGLLGEGDLSVLHAMGRRLEHRGPVSAEWSPAPGVYFGKRTNNHARERSDRQEIPLVTDATLFNSVELGNRLSNRQHEPGPDLNDSLIWSAYCEYGLECLSFLNGDFTLAISDGTRGHLILARDPLGARVLYYTVGLGYIAFASEYKALLVLDKCHPTPDLDALQHLQRSKYLPPGRTSLKGVFTVPSAHWVEITEEGVKEHRYREFPTEPKVTGLHRAAGELRELFLQSVERRTRVTPFPGIELSGGIDSAAIVAAVHKLHPDQILSTFTAGSGPDDPEITNARVIADQYQTDHHEVIIETKSLLTDLPAMVWHLEDPIGRTEAFLSFELMKYAAGVVDVVLGGFASDGLYAGMPRHKLIKLMQVLPLGQHAIEDFYHYTQTSDPPGSILGKTFKRLYFGRSELPPPQIHGAPVHKTRPSLPKGRQGLLNQVLQAGISHGVPGWMPRVQKTHEAYGIEFRSPFTDTDLVSYSLRLPENYKLRGFKDKYILRRALLPLLPERIANRPKFPQRMAYDLELSEVLEALSDQYLNPSVVRTRGFFEPAAIDRLRSRPPGRPYGSNRAMRIWTAVLTEIWAQLFLDHAAQKPY